MKTFAIFTSWNLLKVNDKYYISGTHYTYLEYASKHFKKIYLITSVRTTKDSGAQLCIDSFSNIEVVALPTVDSYLGALKNFRKYSKALNYIKDKVDHVYCRVPDPFCWMPRLVYNFPCVMHYVGDTIDATNHNEKWSWLRKAIMIGGYLPEYFLTLIASKSSTVYTNGSHLKNKLKKYGINTTAVISSTVSENDMTEPSELPNDVSVRMIYVGYLRFAKGMNLLKKLWLKLKVELPNFHFDMVGNGEMENDIKEFISANNLGRNITLHGRIDNRHQLKKLFRQNNLFVFPSLSEGSPRVVIEAMAEGIPVVSTPVGSLPGTFIEDDTIRYFDFDNENQAFDLIKDYVDNPGKYDQMRHRAFEVVRRNFTKEQFLKQIYLV